MEPIQDATPISGQQPTQQLTEQPVPQPIRQAAAEEPRKRPSLRRRALLGAAGVAGFAALARLARGGELSPPAGPIKPTSPSLSEMQAKLGGTVDGLSSKLSSLDGKVAFTPFGVSEPRTPIASLSSSAEAQYVITAPGAYCLTSNLVQVPGQVCIDIQTDHVDIDGQGFVFVGGGGGGGGGFSSCVRASGRQGVEIYDCAFSGWQGASCDFTDCDDVYVSDVLFHACVSPSDASTGSSGAVIRCRDRCGIEDVAVSSCVGATIEMRSSSYCFEVTVIDSNGTAVRCANGCCVEASHFTRVTGDVIVMGNSCAITECDIRQCDGLAISTGSACVVECCECVGGSGGGIHCADGCCVEDCTVLNKDALAIECGSRSSVTDNRVVLCWGMSCASECCCCDNELSSCSGGPDSAQRLGGAIVIHGDLSICESNFISNSRVGISVQLDGSSCHVYDNVITGAGAGADPASGGGAGIVVHDAATGVLCVCNHLRVLPGTPPFVLGSAAFGPIVTLASGDISGIPGSSHPLANTVS